MKLVFASDSFKGSLTSADTGRLLGEAAAEVFGECETICLPVADGGEGTMEAVVQARGGRLVTATVQGPMGAPVTASYGSLGNGLAVIEMAQASGLTLVPVGERNPLEASSYGTGELLLHAMENGCREIAIAIGGSATNDGGMGFARALGVRFLDSEGKELEGRGKDLGRVRSIDCSSICPLLRETKITVMCDVKNPLCGPEGATMTFGRQKGADAAMQEELEAGMCNYRDVIGRQFGIDPDQIVGGGAAGGIGTALRVFAQGEMQSGIETVLSLVGFDDALEGADLVVTGEGRTDWQSCYGKVLQGVGEHAMAQGVPAVAICGSLGPGYEEIYSHGIRSLITTVDAPMSLEEALARAEELYRKAAVRLFRLIRMKY